MYPQVEGIARAELAHALADEDKTADAAAAATEAVRRSPSSTLAVECLTLGADREEVAKRCPNPNREGAGLGEDRYHPEARDVKLWVNAVKITAATDPTKLVAIEGNIRGGGWYKNWLRFVVSLFRSEEQAVTDPDDAEAVILAAFRNLASDTHPFRGRPRAMDLYQVRDIIHETFIRALTLVQTPANFEAALTYLAEVSRGTTSSLQRSPNGPLVPQEFIEILMPFIRSAEYREPALAEIVRQHDRITNGSQLYDNVANADLLLAQAQMESGDAEAANRLWRIASVHLCVYGYRREVSIFDLIYGAAAIGKIDEARAARLLAATQPLVNAVDAHTDGKETQYSPGRWADAVSEVHPVGAAYVLARSLVRHGGAIDWRYEDALRDVIGVARDHGDPPLLTFLDMTLPFAGDDKALENKLSTIARLFREDSEAGIRLLRILAAKVHGDPRYFSPAAYDRVKAFAAGLGVPLPVASGIAELGRKEDSSSSSRPDPLASFKDKPMFPTEATPLALMAAIRTARRSMTEADDNHDRLVNAFGYRIAELLGRGEQDEAIRLLRSFARETYFWEGATPLADLAEGLQRQGYTQAAAVAFSLAYSRSRGGGGYLLLGDEKHLPWLLRAGALSQDISSRALADEVAYLLNQQRHYLGITRHLIEALAAQAETREAAFGVWQAAYDVIRHRLPRNETDYFIFEEYAPDTVPQWTLDEALFFLLIARVCHPELGRKMSATAGLTFVISSSPEIAGRPLRHFLAVDAPVSSALLVLQTLIVAEKEPYAVSVAIQEELRGFYHSGLFGPRVMAQILLERAGLDLGGTRQRVTLTAGTTPRRRGGVHVYDWGQRLEDIGRIWPQFPVIVENQFRRVWEASETQKERAESRHDAAQSRVYKGIPLASILFWELEVFETIFHEVLEGIDMRLWSTGEWHPEFCPRLLDKVLPRLALHIARWYSRVPRPPLPLPRKQRSGVAAPSGITDDGEYDGWYRCGYFETEMVMSDGYHLDEEVTVMSSIDFPKAPGDADPSSDPLAEGKAEDWLNLRDDETEILVGLNGPVAGMDFVRDWLGTFPILMLRPYLQTRLGLSPHPSSQNRLELTDESGSVAVVFRCWSERPVGDSLGEEVPRLYGCDLLMRPDLLERMARMSETGPVTVTFSSRDEGEGNGTGSTAEDAE